MAKLIPYDVSKVEASSGGGSEEPRPAVYPARIVSIVRRDVGAQGQPVDDLHVTLDLGGDYRWLHEYVGLGEASDWKLAELIRALGLPEKSAKGFDPEKQKDKMVRVKVNPGTYEGQYRADAGRLMKAMPGDELPPPGASTNGKAIDDEEPADEPTASGDDGDGDGDFVPSREGEEFGSYDEWEDGDLESEVSDRGITVPGGRGKKRDKWIKALRDDDSSEAAEPGDDDAPDPETPADSAEGDDYDTWEIELLEAEFKDRELDLPAKPKGKNAADRYKAKMIEALREDDAENPFGDDD